MSNGVKTEIFGINFDNLTMNEALVKIRGFVVLPYSEFIVRAQKDKEFKEILNKADLCLCEGRGLWLMTWLLGKKLKEPINGVELIQRISKLQAPKNKLQTNSKLQIPNSKIFLLGGTEEAVQKTAKELGNCVVGFEHGYQDLEKVINKINKTKPEILLVGLGSPKQEKWIYANLKKMPSVKVAIGVGGAFDFISGRIKRAPKFIQKSGLEWLWRLILQPRRIKRISKGVIGLSWLVLKSKIKK